MAHRVVGYLIGEIEPSPAGFLKPEESIVNIAHNVMQACPWIRGAVIATLQLREIFKPFDDETHPLQIRAENQHARELLLEYATSGAPQAHEYLNIARALMRQRTQPRYDAIFAAQ